MTGSDPKILLVDDEEKFLTSIAQRLELLGFDPFKAASGREALQVAANNPIDIAIVDLKMPDMDGLVTIAKLKEIHPDLRSVLLTGHGSEKVKQATEALNARYFEKESMGAFWNFIKSCHQDGNVIVIRPPSPHAPSEMRSGQADNPFGSANIEVIAPRRFSDEALSGPSGGPPQRPPALAMPLRIIGETPAMQDLRRNIKRFASLDCSIILYGETGVGKELAARAIHALSTRSSRRFMAINCGCFSNDLLIEEFLGTGDNEVLGGRENRNQLLGSAPGGTILLDQIEDMPPRMQLAMLKVIDRNRAAQQPGGDATRFDIRILAASHHDLGQLVKAGKFREELYFRLNVVELTIPPLRKRRDDIAPLSSYFLDRFNQEFGKAVESIADEVLSLFQAYDFPGNVRELEHIIERAVILSEGRRLEPRHLPERFLNAGRNPLQPEKQLISLAAMEKQHILAVLQATGKNKSKTAEILGISRAALWRKLKLYNQDEA